MEIPKKIIKEKKGGSIPYVEWNDLKKLFGKKLYKEFEEFMFGQTGYIEGAYIHDIRNFFRPKDKRFFD